MTSDHSDLSNYRAWFLPNTEEPVGYVVDHIATHLRGADLLVETGDNLTLSISDSLDLTLEDVRASLASASLIPPKRGEFMPVQLAPFSSQLAVVDRSAMRALGLWATKIHVNGLVWVDGQAEPGVWLSKRSPSSTAAPLAYDTMIAGGQPAASTREETLAKEAEEEVGISPTISRDATWIKDMVVHYRSDLGLHREVLSIYDLAIPPGFQPDHRDGEIVESILHDWASFKTAVGGLLELKHSSLQVCLDLISRREPA